MTVKVIRKFIMVLLLVYVLNTSVLGKRENHLYHLTAKDCTYRS